MKGLLLGMSLFWTSIALNMAIPLPEPNPNIGWLYNILPFEIFKPNPPRPQPVKGSDVGLESSGEIPIAVVIHDDDESVPVFVAAIAPSPDPVPETPEEPVHLEEAVEPELKITELMDSVDVAAPDEDPKLIVEALGVDEGPIPVVVEVEESEFPVDDEVAN